MLTFTQLLTILGLVFGIVAFLAGVIYKLWMRVIQNSRDLSDYKLVVAEKYVNYGQLNEMEKKNLQSEERLHSAISNLTSRIDRILSRMEK